MQRQGITGFGPVYTGASRALILGSYPSPKSFEVGFYYGHPQNRFWPLLAALFGAALPQSIEEKAALITQNGLALWDSLATCTITGASDSSITDAVPNDIAGLVAKTRIEAVFCNGTAAHRFYHQYCEPQTGLPALRLPSTSPANAAWGLPRLLAAWQPVRAFTAPVSPAGGG